MCETDETIKSQYDELKQLKEWMNENSGCSLKNWFSEKMTEKKEWSLLEQFWNIAGGGEPEEQWNNIKKCFEGEKKLLTKEKKGFSKILTNSIRFLEQTYGRGAEMEMYLNQMLYQKKCCTAAGKVENAEFIRLVESSKINNIIDKEIEEELAAIQ